VYKSSYLLTYRFILFKGKTHMEVSN